ncbi:type II toxin-antitoxin system MqsR family toxin [Mesorhizobium sp.]|uniref:type II toxin-antitoxin system MqsR family toxin n=1 Tax=Mesorhizobium sp. TaxID=1871066 RepID=UPI000FE54F0C|nr:type II toxin-antitoxin system MqsR family toxin [Mesorhizobium sp.]RWP59908.1 MAG: type II toxin-antitoxin system MqsR family toxin [Mesorhizobium sp.]
MEKRRPTYDLDAIKAELGSVDIVEVIGSITQKMFVKSMTTFADDRVWQDVYHVPARELVLYVKFQADVVTGFTVMSFKEK